MSSQCPLAYPDKFQAAAKFWSLQPQGTKPLAQENQLLLYALKQQATIGPNNTPRPWGWGNVVESTKWQGWKELGKMTSIEAMRLFVRTLDEEQPDWWSLLQQAEEGDQETGPAPAAAEGGAAAEAGIDKQQEQGNGVQSDACAVSDRAREGVWTQLEAMGAAAAAGGEGGSGGGRKPLPRYEAAAAVLGDCMYLLGGNYGGRYLSDVWSLHLPTSSWAPLHLTHAPHPAPAAGDDGAAAAGGEAAQPAPADAAPASDGAPAGAAAGFPPTAGHTATAWNGKLYVLGGHSKSKLPGTMAVRVVDPAARTVAEPHTAGTPPAARGGHAAVLLGSQLWVLCGEDSGRRALADVHVLDLESLTWSCPEIGGVAPPGRSACAAAAYSGRYILLFGGGSVASCFNDLHVLDTVTLTWGQPQQAGAKVSSRAGHTGAVLGATWYIVGGGNNVRGCTDLLAADLSQLEPAEGAEAGGGRERGRVTWHVLTSVGLRDPLSSEGISLVALPLERTLLAFGGYNGKYQNAVSVFKAPVEGAPAAAAAAPPSPRDKSPAPVEVAAAAPPPSQSPAGDSLASPPASLALELQQLVSELRSALEGARREAESAIRESAAAKEGAATELALMRKQLTAAQAANAEAYKTLDETRAALGAEQSKVLKLEAQLAEMQAKLAAMGELERELDKHRRAAKEAAERESKRGGGGIWGYIAGGSSSSS